MVSGKSSTQSINKTTEGDTNVPPAYSDDQPTGIPHGLYVLINKKARTLLDLSGGTCDRTGTDHSMVTPDPYREYGIRRFLRGLATEC